MITFVNGLLSEKSKKLVTEHIQNRIVYLVNWKNGKYKVMSIIESQISLLARAIRDETKYRGFIGRF
jgi:CRISPR/Cas system-associated endonuclease Cas1